MRTLLATAALLLAACAPMTDTGGAIALEGTSWRLIEIRGQPPVAGADVTLRFVDGHAEGFASCNQYRGPYTVSGTTLTFDLWPGHPREQEVRGLLSGARAQLLPLWEEVEAYNRDHAGPETYQVHYYCGQYLVEEEEAV